MECGLTVVHVPSHLKTLSLSWCPQLQNRRVYGHIDFLLLFDFTYWNAVAIGFKLIHMCGRYGRRADKQYIAEHYRVRDWEDHGLHFAPSYNIAPTDMQPIVRLNHETGERELAIMRWGLIPFWAKDTKIAYSTINARAETLTTSPVFREAVKRRRCLIPVEWFYEWQLVDGTNKQPYAIALKDTDLFTFAGLWETWKDKKTDTVVQSYTIITCDPNGLMEPFHDRMPVILHPRDYDRWLAPAGASQLPVDLLRPYPDNYMKV